MLLIFVIQKYRQMQASMLWNKGEDLYNLWFLIPTKSGLKSSTKRTKDAQGAQGMESLGAQN